MRPVATDVHSTSHVAWSVCVYVLGTRVSCAKTAELIEMPFGDDWSRCGSNEPCIRWGPDPALEEKLLTGRNYGPPGRHIVTYLCVSAFRTKAFAAARMTRRRCGLLPTGPSKGGG